jgi:hypothetical protein
MMAQPRLPSTARQRYPSAQKYGQITHIRAFSGDIPMSSRAAARRLWRGAAGQPSG